MIGGHPIHTDGDAVRDLVHTRDATGAWVLGKSSYRKLRLAPAWVAEQLRDAGFAEVGVEPGPRGMSVVTAHRAPQR